MKTYCSICGKSHNLGEVCPSYISGTGTINGASPVMSGTVAFNTKCYKCGKEHSLGEVCPSFYMGTTGTLNGYAINGASPEMSGTVALYASGFMGLGTASNIGTTISRPRCVSCGKEHQPWEVCSSFFISGSTLTSTPSPAGYSTTEAERVENQINEVKSAVYEIREEIRIIRTSQHVKDDRENKKLRAENQNLKKQNLKLTEKARILESQVRQYYSPSNENLPEDKGNKFSKN